MQNWEIMSTNNVNNYGESNSWYNNMFAANVKTEPGTSNTKTLLQQQQPHQQHDQHLGSFLRQSQQQRQLLQSQQQHQQQQQPPPPPQFTSLGTNAATVPSLSNNNNEQIFGTTNPQHIMQQQQQYQQQFQHAQQAAAQNQTTSPLMLGFNPLTPPGLPNAVIPTTMSHFYPPNTARCNRETPSPIPINGNVNLEQSEKSILTPRYTPPMDITPPKSPKSTAALTEAPHLDKEQEPDLMSNSSEDLKHVSESGEYDEYIRMPIYNSHGKMKTHKCKTCGLVAMTKVSFWEHTRTHESSEKILQCPKCPFWAKVKHHLDFHICKHKNVKPYKCDKCEYSCENKSMLASHHKKHSSIYHYRCADCDYATKFCHAFKQHLRKYEHKPGLVLDHDGLPNPTVIIDVYGTRRGPKNKTANCGTGSKRMLNGDLKLPSISSQLSAALQGFTNHQTSMPDSPTKSTTSQNSDFPPLNTNNIPLLPQNPSNLNGHNGSEVGHTTLKERRKNNTNHSPTNLTGILPLDTLNHNMTSFLSYYINLQVLAAQQQPGVLAQLSPHMREELQKQQQRLEESINDEEEKTVSDTDEEEDEESDSDEQEHEDKVSKAMNSGKTEASAIDLTQCASNTEHRTPARMEKVANDNEETPLIATTGAAKRKGRVLKLDQDQLKYNNNNNNYEMPSAEKQIFDETSKSPSPVTKKEAKRKLNRSVEDLMDTDKSENISSSHAQNSLGKTSINTSNSSIDTSSSSVSSVSGTVTSSSNANSNTDTLYECAHCHIFFKNAVLHTMHMGYHSCDDVFKCNMCGKKCEDAVGFFVHMARNAHP